MLEIKTNMKAKFNNNWCEACQKKGKTKTETQEHIYKCIELNDILDMDKRPKYKEIFGNKIEHMKKISEVIHKNVINRNET